MSGISRRSFLTGTGLAAMGLAGAAALAGCAPEAPGKDKGDGAEEQAPAQKKEPTQTKEADVVVAGLGAAGLLAAYGAASKGAKVVAVDAASSMAGTTNTRTSAAFAVGSSLQKPAPEPSPSRSSWTT